MGSSMSVACKSVKAQSEMVDFLNRHFREFSVVLMTGRPPSRHPRVLVGDELKYGASTRKIGFNGGGEYEITLLRWISLRVGMKRRFEGLEIAVPWLNCDAQYSEPVILRSEGDPTLNEEFEPYVVDRHGVGVFPDPWPSPYVGTIAAEMARLSGLWDNR